MPSQYQYFLTLHLFKECQHLDKNLVFFGKKSSKKYKTHQKRNIFLKTWHLDPVNYFLILLIKTNQNIGKPYSFLLPYYQLE